MGWREFTCSDEIRWNWYVMCMKEDNQIKKFGVFKVDGTYGRGRQGEIWQIIEDWSYDAKFHRGDD